MNLEYCLFSLFSSFSIISSLMVIGLSNAVHSVLFLIFLFCNIISLLLLLGTEFLALIFLIVYIGAIAVLFLFVIMMLNIKIQPFDYLTYFAVLPIGILISLILFFQFLLTIDSNFIDVNNFNDSIIWVSWIYENVSNSNIRTLGLTLYTKYSFLFLLCSLILLVSMIGVLVLTIHQKGNVKRQVINFQLSRNFKRVIKFLSLR